MPVTIRKPDTANTASKLPVPEELRKLAAWIMSLGETVGGDDPTSALLNPMPMVAMGGGKAIPALKKAGARTAAIARAQMPEYDQAIELLQGRWPRIFGHVNKLAPMDEATKIAQSVGSRVPYGTTHQLGYRTATGEEIPTKLSQISINQETAPFETLGHELLHATDTILNPRSMNNIYQQQIARNKEIGLSDLDAYFAAPDEIRARLMGSRFQDLLNIFRSQHAGGPIPGQIIPWKTLKPNYNFRAPAGWKSLRAVE